jgi:hypothetical protein
MQQGHLGLTDAGFWADPLKTRDDVSARLSKEGFVGVALDAPRRVALDDRRELPVVATNVATFRDNLWLDFHAAAVLAAVDLDTHAIYAAPCFDREPVEWLTEPVPDDDIAEGTTTAFDTFDLRARLGLPWVPSRLLVRLLLADRVSAPVRVDLLHTITAYRDPAVDELVARSRRSSRIASVSPRAGLSLPSYEARTTSPLVPGEPGIALKAPRVQVLAEGTPWVVEGSFRLPVAPHEIVPPDGSVDVGDPLAKAVVPITLILTGSRTLFPQILPLAVPCRGAIDPAKPVAVGHFALDLRAAVKGVDLEAETWFLFALSGEHLAGPVSSAWVDPSSLGAAP